MDVALGSMDGSVRFHGLTPTSMKLEGLDRHLRLIDSYRKPHTARARLQPMPDAGANTAASTGSGLMPRRLAIRKPNVVWSRPAG